MYILGINAYHGDASATLLKDGKVLLAIEEERLNRKKHCAGFPVLAVQMCLDKGGITISDLEHIAISVDPSANLFNKVTYALKRGTKIGKMLKERLGKVSKTRDLKSDLAEHLGKSKEDIRAEIHNVEHHLAHMASAYFSSPYDDLTLITLDGMGDFVSSKWGIGKNGKIEAIGQVEYPHSIGYLYTAITQWLGFPYYGDEGKVMGLAPYGKPVLMAEMEKIIRIPADKPGYELNLDYFEHHEKGIEMQWDDGQPTIGRMYSDKLIELLGPVRLPDSDYNEHYKNVAASLQKRVEDVGLNLINKVVKITGNKTVGFAGGVMLNSVMNGKILDQTDVTDLYIHPNAGDGGTSLGAAQYVYFHKLGNRNHESIEHAYLGLEFFDVEIFNALQTANVNFQKYDFEELVSIAADYIANENVVGWFQDKMEWGPRALGSRSIVADPRNPDMKDILNSRIKKRESFRPFAPSILEEYVEDYFEQTYPSPTMLMVYQIKEEMQKKVPAITHVDGSGRLQTVNQKHHPRYYALISAFYKKTGIPILLNTSFNENEPIVCKPDEAIDCFLRTKMDVLVIGDYIVIK